MFEKFLHRPALAIVISLLILFMGGMAINVLPTSQFPSVAPPSVRVSVSYPGASAKILIDSTMVLLEQSINGVPNMRYMMSDATSAGEGTIQITFEPGTDPNVAVMNVNNRVTAVKNNLPPIVQREGIIVMQNMTSMLMYLNIYSTDKDADQNDLYNYSTVKILNEIKRIPGIGRASILGNRSYAMRVELDLDRMRAYEISSDDIMEALDEQSMIGSPGRLGQATGVQSQTIEYVLTWVGRYQTEDEYNNIILRSNPEGETLRLKDVANVRLGSSFYDLYSDLDGYPSAAIVLKQTPNSNAAEVIDKVKETIERIKTEGEGFPPGMDYKITYDVSKFLDASIEKVVHTLFEAFILVSLVVFLFLGDVRSTLIPTLAVPVSLIGTFFFMLMFGMSINLITLFALVLAIGVVVDDAIVVVEAVHEKMAAKHIGPYQATKEVVREISGAIIAITLVMTAVFVPVTFIPGPVGVFYRQFALTMAMSIVLSGVVALTLTPVLCAMILKPHTDGAPQTGLIAWLNRDMNKTGKFAIVLRTLLVTILGLGVGAICYGLLHIPLVHEVLSEQLELTDERVWIISGIVALLGIVTFAAKFSGSRGGKVYKSPIAWFLHLFDRGVERVTGMFGFIVDKIIMRRVLTLVVIAAFAWGIIVVNQSLPAGFIPLEDQGMIYGIVQTPPGSTLEYTNKKCAELREICKTKVEDVTSVSTVAGYEVLTEGRGSNAGTCIINLKPWNEREKTSKEIIEELEEHGVEIAGVKLEFFEPPAVPGFGAAGGFSINLLDKTNSGDYKNLGEQTDRFMEALGKRKELKGLFTFFAADYPQYEIIIDNQAAMQKGVTIREAMDNLSIVVGSTWEQGFVRFGQFYKVYVQAKPEFRRFPSDLDNMFVKNDEGEMVPYSAFMRLEKKQGLNEISRYNLYPTAPIQGTPAAGYSSGEALAAVSEVAKETLPPGFDIGHRGLAYDEVNAGNTAFYIFIVVVIFVYLLLVAQYESFLIPIGVLASLPIGLFGAFLVIETARLGQRRLLSNWFGDAGRFAWEKCDPDFRIRRSATQ